jgi:hypothetical protein
MSRDLVVTCKLIFSPLNVRSCHGNNSSHHFVTIHYSDESLTKALCRSLQLSSQDWALCISSFKRFPLSASVHAID